VRILYHHRTLGDGAEGIHIASMVQAFRDLGHEVQITGLVPSRHGDHRRDVVEHLRSALPRVAFEAASVAYNVPEYVQVRSAMKRFRPDLLYKRHAKFDLAALRAAHCLNIPSVLEVDVLFSGTRYRLFEPIAMYRTARALERRALLAATVVVAVSTPLARQARELANVDVVVLPNGVDPVRFDPHRVDGASVRARYGVRGALVVGWAGVLREWHGLERLLHACAELPGVMLLIVGDGPARPALERTISMLGLQQRVVITGRVAHEDMPAHLAAMDIAVVPDEKTGIASPMKLLEYMSMGIAVVAPRAENIREVVEDEVDGLLFEPGDTRDLTVRLQRLTEDPALRAALGKSARWKIERHRSWQSVADAVLRSILVKAT